LKYPVVVSQQFNRKASLPDVAGHKKMSLLLLVILWMLVAAPSARAAAPSNAKWSRTVKGHSYSPPQVAHGTLYVATDDGILYAFNQQSGKIKWRFRTDYSLPCSALVGEDGMVYLSSNNGSLYVLSAFNGSFSWKSTPEFSQESTPDDKLPYSHIYSPALTEKLVLQSAPGGRIDAYERKTGNRIWSFTTMGDFITSPSIYKNMVFFGCEDGRLVALDIASGKQEWSFFAEKSILYPPAIKKGLLYFGAEDKEFYVLEAATGEPLWTYSAQGHIASTPVFYQDLAYFSSAAGKLYAVDIKKHRLAMRFDTHGSTITQPVVDNGVIYLGSNDGRLYAFSGSRAKLMWAYDTKALLVNTVTTSNKLIFALANQGQGNRSRTNVFALPKNIYPETEILAFDHGKDTFTTSFRDYFLSTAKQKWTEGDRVFDLSDSIPWPFGYQFNQAGQTLVDLSQSEKSLENYNLLAKNLGYFSPGLSSILLLSSFQFTSWSLLLLISFLFLGGSFFVTLFSALGGIKIIFLSASPAIKEEPTFSLTRVCLESIAAIVKNYQILLTSVIITTAGALVSLALFNHLAPVPTARTFYSAILLTWLIVLIAGSFVRAFNLAFLQRDQLGLQTFSLLVRYALAASAKLFLFSVLCLASTVTICFLLQFGQFQSHYLTAVAIFGLTLTVLLWVFADNYIVRERIGPYRALIKSSRLTILHLHLVIPYILFVSIVLGLCSLLVSWLMHFSFGPAMSILAVVIASSYLTPVHTSIFQELTRK
jgi:outer membrane protein assembly factor BamB